MSSTEKIQEFLSQAYNGIRTDGTSDVGSIKSINGADKVFFKQVTTKLVKDGYILDNVKVTNHNVKVEITFEGRLFYESGGYTEQLRQSKSKTNRQNLLNIIVALGTGFAGVYALWQFYLGVVNMFYCCN